MLIPNDLYFHFALLRMALFSLLLLLLLFLLIGNNAGFFSFHAFVISSSLFLYFLFVYFTSSSITKSMCWILCIGSSFGMYTMQKYKRLLYIYVFVYICNKYDGVRSLTLVSWMCTFHLTLSCCKQV